MKKNIFYSAIAILALASCTTETSVEQIVIPEASVAPGKEVTIHAGFDYDDTRTVVQAGGKVYWSPGDQISVTQGFSNDWWSSVFTSTNTEPAASADFTGVLPAYSSETWAIHPYFCLVFPHKESNYYTSVGARFEIPATQTVPAGSYQKDAYMAAAYTGDLTDIHFQHPLGGIVISVDEPGIEKIVLKATGGESIAGDVSVDCTLGYGYDVSTGRISLNEKDTQYGGKPINSGPREITVLPEGGTFIPGEDYYVVMRPTTLTQGFSLYVYKADGRGTKLSINKSVEVRRSEFRTLRDCDADFDWNNTVITFDKTQVFLGCFSGGFYTRVICPGPYTLDEMPCDWITEIMGEDEEGHWPDQPYSYNWSQNLASPEHYGIGGDARFDGCYHMFAVKANYGAERSATLTFRHNGNSYTVQVTQAAGDWLPQIRRTHFGCVFHTLDDHLWNANSDAMLEGYVSNQPGASNCNHVDGSRMEWVQGAYGQNGSEVFLAGHYLYLGNPAISGGHATDGLLAGHIDIEEYVTAANIHIGQNEYTSGAIVDIMDAAMDEIDEWYIPTTSIAVTSNECVEQEVVVDGKNTTKRDIDITVEVFASRAGTYRLTGLIVEEQISYIPGGMLFAAFPENAIIGYVTDYRGQEITFESDNSTKTVTLHAVPPPHFGGVENWQAGMIDGNYGDWDQMWMVFFTASQFGEQAQFKMGGRATDYYVDNCLYVKFNTTYDHDGTSH